MAIKITLDSFLAVIKRSNLLSEEQLNAALEKFRSAKGPTIEAKPFAEYLVRHKFLSIWQAEKVLQGKHKGFFLGRYRLLSLLGKGGMSSVYLAEHTVMKRQCALKVLPAKRVNDASYLGRFHREAQAVAALDHPNIVRAYDVDMVSDSGIDIHFLAMEFVQGKSLLELVGEKGIMSPADAIEVIRQSALGLEHAHRAGLVHRDIKPGNLLMTSTGTIKVLDLGLARFFDDEDASLTVQHDEKVLGTADYISPEQAIDSHNVDRRTDIYSLGCTLYFLLTGHPPFNTGSLAQRLVAHQNKRPPSVTSERTDVPPELVAILEKLMAKKLEERFQTAQEVADAISAWQKAASTAPIVHVAVPDPAGNHATLSTASQPRAVTQSEVTSTPSMPRDDTTSDPLGSFLSEISDPALSDGGPSVAILSASSSKSLTQSAVETTNLANSGTEVSPVEGESEILDLNLIESSTTDTAAAPFAAAQAVSEIATAQGVIPQDNVDIDPLEIGSQGSTGARSRPKTSRSAVTFRQQLTPRRLGSALAVVLLIVLSAIGWQVLSRESKPPTISANAKPAKPLPPVNAAILEVGPQGHFTKIQDAIEFVRKNFRPLNASESRTIQVAGGYTYPESIQITSGGRSHFPRNVTIKSTGPKSAVIESDGKRPALALEETESLTLDGFVIDAGGGPTAMRIAGYSPTTRVANITIRNFTRTGLELADAAAQTGEEIQLDGLRMIGKSSSAVGIRCQTVSGGNTVCIAMAGLRVIGPLESGIESSGTFWKSTISDSIFVNCDVGLRFRRGTLMNLSFVNNTFSKNRVGIALSQIPETGSGQVRFAQNLFSGNTDGDAILEHGSATGLADWLLTSDGRQLNRSDRANPDTNGIDLFSGDGLRGAVVTFASEDPDNPSFLKPTSGNISLAAPVDGARPYFGAVAP